MKNLLILIATIATIVALSFCVEHKRPTSSPLKRVRARYMSMYAGHVYLSRVTCVLEVDTMYTIGDTILYSNNHSYVIVK
jgi:hypothetical protein